MNTSIRSNRIMLSLFALAIACGSLTLGSVSAYARGGGHAGSARAASRSSVNHAAGRSTTRNNNVNRNTNINSNRNVNVNVNSHHDDHWNHYDHYDHYHHPIATGVAIGATAAVTSAVIGSIVYSVPPSCATVIVNGIGYSQCGSTWYQPRYAGSSVQYVVVAAPR